MDFGYKRYQRQVLHCNFPSRLTSSGLSTTLHTWNQGQRLIAELLGSKVISAKKVQVALVDRHEMDARWKISLYQGKVLHCNFPSRVALE